MALKEFQVSNRWWDGLFGDGHTVATDPGKRGWRAALAAPGSGVLVVGRRGVAGCMSVMQMSDGRFDVAVYDDVTPESLAESARTRCPMADVFRQVEAIPGWSLPFIDMIEHDG